MSAHAPIAIADLALEMQKLIEMRVSRINSALDWLNSSITPLRKHIGEEIHFMLKNKTGLTKTQAQKLFYDYKNKGNDEDNEKKSGQEQKQPKEQGNIDQKISMIMNYMQETSIKLDQIEKDISHLREQVDRILEKI